MREEILRLLFTGVEANIKLAIELNKGVKVFPLLAKFTGDKRVYRSSKLDTAIPYLIVSLNLSLKEFKALTSVRDQLEQFFISQYVKLAYTGRDPLAYSISDGSHRAWSREAGLKSKARGDKLNMFSSNFHKYLKKEL